MRACATLQDPMRDRYTAPKTPLTAFLYWTFIYLLLMVWLTGMTAGLAAGACKYDRYDDVRMLRACNISLTAGAWFDIFPHDRAHQHAQAKKGPWHQQLHSRLQHIDDPHAQALWRSVANRPRP
jgi:heme A synthase